MLMVYFCVCRFFVVVVVIFKLVSCYVALDFMSYVDIEI